MFCKKCGTEYSDDAKFCPNCATPNGETTPSQAPVTPMYPPKKKKKGWIIALVAIVLVIVIISIANPGRESDPGTSQGEGTPKTEQNNQEKDEWIKSGSYKIGTDLSAGEYLIKSSSGMCYVQVSSDSSGKLDSIISNDNVATHIYVTVKDGQYLEVKGGKLIQENKAEAFKPVDGKYKEGMYKVGKDIPAGEYKVHADDSGYLQVSKDSKGTIDSIVTNDNFAGDKYITVKEGQYLTVKNGYINAK